MTSNDWLGEIKVAIAAIAATAGTGVAKILDLIPEDIGKLAVVVSIVLSSIIIYVQLQNVRKTKLEIEIMARKEKERQQGLERRKDYG